MTLRTSPSSRRLYKILHAIGAWCVLAFPVPAADEPSTFDWPCWRGPNGDGISLETDFLKRWPTEGLPELWRIAIGSGFSSFAAVGDKLYTAAQRGEGQEVLCLEALTGELVWKHSLEEGYDEKQGGDGPRATPAVADGVVYALVARGTLADLSAEDGEPIWEVDVLEKFNARSTTWGLSASPVVYEDLLLVVVGAANAPVVALDRDSGDMVWISGSDGQGDIAGYSTPYVVMHDEEPQILTFLGRSLVSLEPDEGRVNWRYYWQTSFDVNAAAPIYSDGKVFISSGYGHGAALITVPERGRFPKLLWESKVFKNKFSSCVLQDGFLYGFDNTILKCAEFATGKERWGKRGFGFGSVLLADGHLFVLGENGALALVRAKPDAYVEASRVEKVLTGSVAWTVPVLHRGVLYLRNLKEAVALDLRSSPGG